MITHKGYEIYHKQASVHTGIFPSHPRSCSLFLFFFLISTSDLIGDIRKRKLGLVGFIVAVCLIWVLSV